MLACGTKRRRSLRQRSEQWSPQFARHTDSVRVTTWGPWRACTASNEAGARDILLVLLLVARWHLHIWRLTNRNAKCTHASAKAAALTCVSYMVRLIVNVMAQPQQRCIVDVQLAGSAYVNAAHTFMTALHRHSDEGSMFCKQNRSDRVNQSLITESKTTPGPLRSLPLPSLWGRWPRFVGHCMLFFCGILHHARSAHRHLGQAQCDVLYSSRLGFSCSYR